jgi:hypothetical protein
MIVLKMIERLKEDSKVMLQDFDAVEECVPGAHPASYTMDNGSFLRVKQPGSGNDHPPPSRPELEIYSYTSTPPVGLHGLF